MRPVEGGPDLRPQGERSQGCGAARGRPERGRKHSRPSPAARWCSCGREIIRGGNVGRWPTRCTICRNLPPPPYEDHDRAKASPLARTAGRPIGEPYAQMTPAQQDAWREMVAEMPWLNSAHRTLLRLACIISARLDQTDVGVNQLQTLSAILSKLGATPVDETRVTAPSEDDTDPADRFFSPDVRNGFGRPQ